ncbi:hypothetical protein JHK85_043055 [Glycine max]|nr:hypothetical protein JHK85_043055 [Glycine max]
MAPPTDLRVIASEGFDLIDKFCGPSAPRRPNNMNGVFPARQGRWMVQVPNDELEEPMSVINSREAAARYGGIMIVNYPKKPKLASMAPTPADLRKIGAEGFALIDMFYGPPRRNSANYAYIPWAKRRTLLGDGRFLCDWHGDNI